MNVSNLILITAAVVIWTQVVQYIQPEATNRRFYMSLIGSCVIGVVFNLSGISIIGGQ